MSILINGMEMPTGNNAVSIIIFPNGKVSLAHDHRFAEYAEAVPVPAHGRLIDADALISRCKDEKGSYYGHESAIIGEAVESAPTVIEAED